jgi:multisubunit Na+/H+ antiporter MnhE subunit
MPTLWLLVLIGLTIALIALFVFRPQITPTLAQRKSRHFWPYLPVFCARMAASAPSGFSED